MQALLCFLLLLAGALPKAVPRPGIGLSQVKFQGLSVFASTRTHIISRLGKPIRITQPKYECGFLSSAEQGKTYYSLHYQNLTFTGNAAEGYILEDVKFDAAGKITLTYKQWKFNSKTTVQNFERIFGQKVMDGTDPDGTIRTLIYSEKQGEDGAMFHFKNDKLVAFEYWSPC